MRRVYNVHMIWWPLKKLPQVIHVWLSEFPFHEILCLAFYSFLYKKCISSQETLVDGSRKFCEEKKKIYLGICQKWIVISCSSIIFFLSFIDENGKKGRNSLLHHFDLIFDELSIVRATQKEVKWPQLLLSRKRYFFDKKKTRFFCYFECCINFLNSFNRG